MSAFRLVAAFGGAQILVLCSTPFLARVYQPEAFGLYGSCLTIATSIAPIAALRSDIRLAQCNRSIGQNVRILCFGVASSAIFSAICALVTFLVSATLIDPLSSAICAIASGGVCFALAVLSLTNTQDFKCGRNNRVASQRVVYACTQITAQVVLGWFSSLAFLGLVLGHLIGGVASIGPRAWRILRQTKRIFRLESGEFSKDSLRQRLLETRSTGLGAVSLASPTLMVTLAFDAKSAGLFFIAHRLASMPLQLGVQVLSQYFGVQVAGQSSHQRYSEILRLFIYAALASAGITVFTAAALHLFGEWLLGENWGDAIEYALLLLPAAATRLAVLPGSQILLMMGKSEAQWTWEKWRFALYIIPFVVAVSLGAAATTAVAVIAVTTMLGYASLALITIREVRSAISP